MQTPTIRFLSLQYTAQTFGGITIDNYEVILNETVIFTRREVIEFLSDKVFYAIEFEAGEAASDSNYSFCRDRTQLNNWLSRQ